MEKFIKPRELRETAKAGPPTYGHPVGSEECGTTPRSQGCIGAKAPNQRRHQTFENDPTELPPNGKVGKLPQIGVQRWTGCREFDTNVTSDSWIHGQTTTAEKGENVMYELIKFPKRI